MSETLAWKQKCCIDIEDFNKAVQSLHSCFGDVVNKIEVTDGEEALTCKQKIELLKSAKDDFEDSSTKKLSAILSMNDNISAFIDSYDMKQAEDQVCYSTKYPTLVQEKLSDRRSMRGFQEKEGDRDLCLNTEDLVSVFEQELYL